MKVRDGLLNITFCMCPLQSMYWKLNLQCNSVGWWGTGEVIRSCVLMDGGVWSHSTAGSCYKRLSLAGMVAQQVNSQPATSVIPYTHCS